jgi:hypothetical protein
MRLPAVVLQLVPCAVVVIAALSGVGGCALVDQKVPLNYAHQPARATPARSSVAGTGNAAGEMKLSSNPDVGSLAAPLAIAIARPTEPTLQRNKKNQPIIGTVRNSYGMETATSITEDSIPDWIAGAFATELNAAGYAAQVVDKLPPGCTRGLELEVTRIWVDQDPGWWTVGGLGDVQFKMTVIRNGQPVEQIEFTGKGQHRGAFGDTTPKARALEKALQQCIQQAVPYINAGTGTAAAKG